jgi:hypothetical protein
LLNYFNVLADFHLIGSDSLLDEWVSAISGVVCCIWIARTSGGCNISSLSKIQFSYCCLLFIVFYVFSEMSGDAKRRQRNRASDSPRESSTKKLVHAEKRDS